MIRIASVCPQFRRGGTRVRRLAVLLVLAVASCRDPSGPDGDSDLAVDAPGDTLFSALVGGGNHSCALTVGGRAYCWGGGSSGQLGIGSIPTDCHGEPASPYSGCVNAPVRVAGGLRFTRLSASTSQTCGLTPTGRLYCWGLLQGTTHTVSPIPVGGIMRFTELSVGGIICAISTDRSTYCWGDNVQGRLGIPLFIAGTPFDDARAVMGGPEFATVHAPGRATCGVTASGTLYCWGGPVDSVRFELGDAPLSACTGGKPPPTCTHRPLKWRGAERWSRMASSGHACAITTSGGATCWGNTFHEWGSTPTGRSESWEVLAAERHGVPLALPTPVRDIVGSPGNSGACAHAMDGRVVCWGSSLTGEFGTGLTRESYLLPTIVAGGRTFTELSAGWGFMCGLASSRDIWCWGNGAGGMLGTGAVIPVDATGHFRPIPTPTRIASIAGR